MWKIFKRKKGKASAKLAKVLFECSDVAFKGLGLWKTKRLI
jgi:hypothetical protein